MVAFARKIGYDFSMEETFMNDLEERIWKVLSSKQTAALATVTAAGAPWVRYVSVESDPDFTLRFCTSRASHKVRHIEGNPEVHLTCGNLQPPDDSAYLQVAGRAEIRGDAATKLKYWQEGWKAYFQGPEDPDYVMVFVRPYRIEYTGPGSFEPEIWEK